MSEPLSEPLRERPPEPPAEPRGEPPGDRGGLFAGDDPFDLARRWLAEARATEPNDPEAIALATVDADGLPNARVVLLKAIEGGGADGSFVFYTNYGSAKAREIEGAGAAAFVLHWKSLRRQVRVRGRVTREEGPAADAYFASRHPESRVGAWASRQSAPVASRAALLAEAGRVREEIGPEPERPPFWGGYRIAPVEIEFWADGAFRLHDRFRWSRAAPGLPWDVSRLYP
jgi:pyridoxamine 5'-phosphate oxidase